MLSSRRKRAEELFQVAVDLEPEARSKFLDEQCGTDTALREDVEDLLRAHEHVVELLQVGGDERIGFLDPVTVSGATEPAASEESQRLSSDRLPERMGDYVIEGEIGRGGMGRVYLAVDTKLDRQAAIKLLPDKFSNDTHRVALFKREAITAAHLNHPNIATIYGFHELQGRHYLAMEYVEGQTLRNLLDEDEPVPLLKFLDIAVQMAEGLTAAHKGNVVHRDLKPGNVMITDESLVKILDFGLAKAVESDVPSELALTGPGDMSERSLAFGTIGYSSPEQCSNDPVDFRSDLFSFGVVLYELATGVAPFRRNDFQATYWAVLNSNPDSARSLNPHLPQKVAQLIGRLLEKRPEDRLQSSAEVLRLLHRYKRWAEAKYYGRKRRMRVMVSAVMLAALVLAFETWRVRSSGWKMDKQEELIRLQVETAAGMATGDPSAAVGIYFEAEEELGADDPELIVFHEVLVTGIEGLIESDLSSLEDADQVGELDTAESMTVRIRTNENSLGRLAPGRFEKYTERFERLQRLHARAGLLKGGIESREEQAGRWLESGGLSDLKEVWRIIGELKQFHLDPDQDSDEHPCYLPDVAEKLTERLVRKIEAWNLEEASLKDMRQLISLLQESSSNSHALGPFEDDRKIKELAEESAPYISSYGELDLEEAERILSRMKDLAPDNSRTKAVSKAIDAWLEVGGILERVVDRFEEKSVPEIDAERKNLASARFDSIEGPRDLSNQVQSLRDWLEALLDIEFKLSANDLEGASRAREKLGDSPRLDRHPRITELANGFVKDVDRAIPEMRLGRRVIWVEERLAEGQLTLVTEELLELEKEITRSFPGTALDDHVGKLRNAWNALNQDADDRRFLDAGYEEVCKLLRSGGDIREQLKILEPRRARLSESLKRRIAAKPEPDPGRFDLVVERSRLLLRISDAAGVLVSRRELEARPEGWLVLGQAEYLQALDQGDEEGRKNALQHFTELSTARVPKNVRALALLGRALCRSGDSDALIRKDLKAAIAGELRSANAYLLLAHTFLTSGEGGEASQAAEQAAAAPLTELDVVMAFGGFGHAADLMEAMERFEWDLRLVRAQAHWEERQYEQAREHLEWLVDHISAGDPKSHEVLEILDSVEERYRDLLNGNPEEVGGVWALLEACDRRVVELDVGEDEKLRQVRARANLRLKRYAEIIADDGLGNSPRGLLLLAMAIFKQDGSFSAAEEAIQLVRKALSLEPDKVTKARARKLLGTFKLRTDQPILAEVRAEFQAAVDLEIASLDAHYQLAITWMPVDEVKPEELQFAIKAAGDALRADFSADDVILALDGYGKTAGETRRFLLCDIHCLLATARLFTGDNEGAVSDCNRALDLDRSYLCAYFFRGCAHQGIGHIREAERDLQAFMDLAEGFSKSHPDFGRVQQLMKRARERLRELRGRR